jgi:DNA-binding XRE family transcriptional regulator
VRFCLSPHTDIRASISHSYLIGIITFAHVLTYMSFSIWGIIIKFGKFLTIMDYSEYINIIAENLKNIRKQQNISQKELSLRTKVHIGRIETGRANPSLETLCKLCLSLGCNMDELFAGISTKKTR